MGLTLGDYGHMIRYKPGSQHGNAKLTCIPPPNSGPCSLHGLPELLALDNASAFPVQNARTILKEMAHISCHLCTLLPGLG